MTCCCCDADDVLRVGGLLNQPICASCTLAHAVAPEVLANFLSLGVSVVELDGERLQLTATHAAAQLARKLSERHRRLGSASLFDWSGDVVFPDLPHQQRTND